VWRARGGGLAWLALAAGLALGACGSSPELTKDDARAFTERALADAGVSGVTVSPAVVPSRCGAGPVQGWTTTARVAGGTVELCVEREGDEAAFVRDEADGGGPLLTDQQVARIDAFVFSPAEDRRRDLYVWGITGAFAMVLVAAGHALVRLGFWRD
jgi:hypothetical protein